MGKSEKLSQLLVEIEHIFLDYLGEKLNLSDDEFRACCRIFLDAMMDKMFDLQENEDMDIEDRMNMAQHCGEEIRRIVKSYTGVETHDMYKK